MRKKELDARLDLSATDAGLVLYHLTLRHFIQRLGRHRKVFPGKDDLSSTVLDSVERAEGDWKREEYNTQGRGWPRGSKRIEK